MALNDDMCFNEDIAIQELPTWKFWKKRRYVVATLAFFGFFYDIIINMILDQILIERIINKTFDYDYDEIGDIDNSTYDTPGKINMVLSSSFYGYIVSQLPGGWLANRFGGNKVFGISIGAATLLKLVTPLLVKNTSLLIAVRVLTRMFEGVKYPSIYAIWARWAPPLERSRLVTIAFSGTYISAAVSMLVYGYFVKILGHYVLLYSFGMFALIWSLIWWRVVKGGPELDPKISQIELKYIQESLGNRPGLRGKNLKYPWRNILKSGPVWAIIAAHFSEMWGLDTLLLLLAIYVRDVSRGWIDLDGLIFAISYLFFALVLLCAGYLADWLQYHKYLNTTQVRKLFNCSTLITQSILTMGATYIGGPVACIICIVLGTGLGGFAWSGFSVNLLDIAPQHASVLMGISNTLATSTILIRHFIINNNILNDEVQLTLFYISGGIYLIGAIIYGSLCSGVLQPWAMEQEFESSQTDTE